MLVIVIAACGERMITVTGVVRDAETGEVMPDATVTLFDVYAFKSAEELIAVKSGANGEYSIYYEAKVRKLGVSANRGDCSFYREEDDSRFVEFERKRNEIDLELERVDNPFIFHKKSTPKTNDDKLTVTFFHRDGNEAVGYTIDSVRSDTVSFIGKGPFYYSPSKHAVINCYNNYLVYELNWRNEMTDYIHSKIDSLKIENSLIIQNIPDTIFY